MDKPTTPRSRAKKAPAVDAAEAPVAKPAATKKSFDRDRFVARAAGEDAAPAAPKPRATRAKKVEVVAGVESPKPRAVRAKKTETSVEAAPTSKPRATRAKKEDASGESSSKLFVPYYERRGGAESRPPRAERPVERERPARPEREERQDRRPSPRAERPERGDRPARFDRSADSRPPRSEGAASGERRERVPGAFGKKPNTYAGKDGDRPAAPGNRGFGRDRAERGERPTNERKASFGRSSEKPAYGDRNRSQADFHKENKYKPRRADGDRPAFGERKPYGDKPAFGERKPYGDKPAYGERKPYGDKPAFGERKPYAERAASRPEGPGRRDDAPAFGDKPARKPTSFTDNALRRQREQTAKKANYGRGFDEEGKLDEGDGKIRLNRFIAAAGICSRREADKLIEEGRVSVNGKTVAEMGYKVLPTDEVRFSGRLLRPEKNVYILMNKPKDVITTLGDEEGRRTVLDLLGDQIKERIYPVGRLDRNTTGLLLLTNDGELADRLMHPSFEIRKVYQADLDKPITDADVDAIRRGLRLEDGLAPVDDLAVLSPDRKSLGLELHIGRNRIVRRIFEHLGYNVVRLDRVMYGGLTKKDLPRGKWRQLSAQEVVNMKHLGVK